jgi:hypothetical protein
MWLTVLLSLLTVTSTLAAFGGEAWRKGSEPLLSRITARGWVSLICLLLTFGFGLLKEFRTADEQQQLSGRLAEKTSQVARVQDRLSMTQAALDLERSVNNLSNANFMQLEVRFNALAPIGQTIYHGLTYFDGASTARFEDEYGQPLVLYAGDSVSVVLEVMQKNYPRVGLTIGQHSYELNEPGPLGVVPTEFAVIGDHSEPMSVHLINPEHASGSIKWFVTSTTTIRQDMEFKKLLSSVDVPDHVRTSYMIVRRPGTIITATPDPHGSVVERPQLGFLVKQILSTEQWSQIQMPGGKLGWIPADALEVLR